MADIPKEFFHDPDEQVRGVLGQGYIGSLVSGQGFSRSVMYLTDKRLYQRGRIYEKDPTGRWTSSKGVKAVSVRDITGTSFSESSPIAFLIIGIICTVMAIGLLIALPFAPSHERGFLFLPVALCVLAGVGGILRYVFGRIRTFVVHYAGGSIGANCRWYPEEEIEAFQRTISREKDRVSQGG